MFSEVVRTASGAKEKEGGQSPAKSALAPRIAALTGSQWPSRQNPTRRRAACVKEVSGSGLKAVVKDCLITDYSLKITNRRSMYRFAIRVYSII